MMVLSLLKNSMLTAHLQQEQVTTASPIICDAYCMVTILHGELFDTTYGAENQSKYYT
uniref:Uncharacterized protein n=1 Tax=Rhizophora mucronata TaxID=61149 RepID=A0A2P2LFD6_RHIMU